MPAPRPLWSNFHRNDGLPPNKSFLGIKIEFRLPVDKLIDRRLSWLNPLRSTFSFIMCEIVSESIGALRWGISAGDPSGPTAFPGTRWIFLTKLFQQLNRSMSAVPILSLELLVEVTIFSILLVNAAPSGIRLFVMRLISRSCFSSSTICIWELGYTVGCHSGAPLSTTCIRGHHRGAGVWPLDLSASSAWTRCVALASGFPSLGPMLRNQVTWNYFSLSRTDYLSKLGATN